MNIHEHQAKQTKKAITTKEAEDLIQEHQKEHLHSHNEGKSNNSKKPIKKMNKTKKIRKK